MSSQCQLQCVLSLNKDTILLAMASAYLNTLNYMVQEPCQQTHYSNENFSSQLLVSLFNVF